MLDKPMVLGDDGLWYFPTYPSADEEQGLGSQSVTFMQPNDDFEDWGSCSPLRERFNRISFESNPYGISRSNCMVATCLSITFLAAGIWLIFAIQKNE